MSSPSSPDGMELPPPSTLAIHLDLVGGIAGDMFVAAIADALPMLQPRIMDELAAIRPDGAAMPAFAAATQAGLRARRFGLPAAEYRVAPRRSRAEGTRYLELRHCVEESRLTSSTREHALAIFALLADAEAHVHGTTTDHVHFHELADWDSLMDVVAAGCIAASLAGARWTASRLPLGSGQVRTAHGMLPVPVPATCALLEGYPWHDDAVPGERVTPTGAAIVRHLVAPSDCGGRSAAGRMVSIGCRRGIAHAARDAQYPACIGVRARYRGDRRRCGGRHCRGARIRYRRHDRRGDLACRRALARAVRCDRRLARRAPWQEGTAR